MDIALIEVAEGVHSRIGEDLLRRAGHILAVDQCEIREDLMWDRSLYMLVMSCQNRDSCNFRTGTGRSGDLSDRKRGCFRCFVVHVLPSVIRVIYHQRDRLRGVHGGSSTDTDNKIRPDFIYSLHNAGFGGVYWYLTKDLDQGLYESLYEAPRKQNIPIHFGEPESPALKVFYPAVFEGGGICSEYDYLEKYGIKDIAKEIDCGTCSDEYASNLCGSITFLTEMPYFYDSRIDDRSESDLTRADALKQKIAWTMASNQKLKDALAISEDCMGDHNPFRDSVVCFMKEGGDEGHYRSLRENMISLPWRPPGKSAGANRWP